jgi:hypothetical protein
MTNGALSSRAAYRSNQFQLMAVTIDACLNEQDTCEQTCNPYAVICSSNAILGVENYVRKNLGG